MSVPSDVREEVAVIVPVVSDDAVRDAMNPLVKVSPVPERAVVEAFVAVSAWMNPLVKVSPVPERAVVEALVTVRVDTVVVARVEVPCTVIPPVYLRGRD